MTDLIDDITVMNSIFKEGREILNTMHQKQSFIRHGNKIGRDSDAGRAWGQEEKGTTEDEMAGWHHWLDGRESE